ncbi:MAG: FABP family protein [Pseudomonadales bacterium]|nr:FABP family protein [Pseudomonadales bacterium]
MTTVDQYIADDYGPLAVLLGTWRGDKGLDVAPDPDGKEENHYYESLVFEGIGEVDNAESQHLMAVRYQQRVWRDTDDKAIHHQLGYWLWDKESGVVMNSFTIPRGICVLAGGHVKSSHPSPKLELNVKAKADGEEWGIIQSPFMKDNARTLEFSQTLCVEGDNLSYEQTTMVDIYGRTFEHTDRSNLVITQRTL